MEVGAVTESVEVTGRLPYVNTDNPEVGTNLSRTDLLDVRLSISGGRGIRKLWPTQSCQAWPGTRTSHINGSASFSKEVLLDGASVTTYMADLHEAAGAAGQPRSILRSGEIDQRTKGVRWYDPTAKADDGGTPTPQLRRFHN
jgi:hypothetical protein